MNKNTTMPMPTTKHLYGKRTYASIEELAEHLSRVAGAGIIDNIVELFYYTSATAGHAFKVLESDGFKIEVVMGDKGAFEYTLSIFLENWTDAVLPEEEYIKHLILQGPEKDRYQEYLEALNTPQGDLLKTIMAEAVYYYRLCNTPNEP